MEDQTRWKPLTVVSIIVIITRKMKSESSRATAFPDGFDECGPSVGQTAPFKIQILEISCCHGSSSFLTSQANVT
jgi:hypothetical protein